jgi:hypothetical protein
MSRRSRPLACSPSHRTFRDPRPLCPPRRSPREIRHPRRGRLGRGRSPKIRHWSCSKERRGWWECRHRQRYLCSRRPRPRWATTRRVIDFGLRVQMMGALHFGWPKSYMAAVGVVLWLAKVARRGWPWALYFGWPKSCDEVAPWVVGPAHELASRMKACSFGGRPPLFWAAGALSRLLSPLSRAPNSLSMPLTPACNIAACLSIFVDAFWSGLASKSARRR